MIRELKNLATIITRKHNLTPIKIEFKAVRRGRARSLTRAITIPIWIFGSVKEYRYYYIIHELVHFIQRDKFKYSGHGEEFKRIESKILKDYNIIPVYNKAYAKELRNLEGEILCGKFGEKKKQQI